MMMIIVAADVISIIMVYKNAFCLAVQEGGMGHGGY